MENEDLDHLVREAREAKHAGDFGRAKMLRAQLERLQDQIGATSVDKAKNLNMLAFVAAASGDVVEAVRAAEKCLATYLEVSGKNAETLATYEMMLAYVLAEAGRFPEAIWHGEKCLAEFSRILGKDDDFVMYRAADIESMRRGEIRLYLDRGG